MARDARVDAQALQAWLREQLEAEGADQDTQTAQDGPDAVAIYLLRRGGVTVTPSRRLTFRAHQQQQQQPWERSWEKLGKTHGHLFAHSKK